MGIVNVSNRKWQRSGTALMPPRTPPAAFFFFFLPGGHFLFPSVHIITAPHFSNEEHCAYSWNTRVILEAGLILRFDMLYMSVVTVFGSLRGGLCLFSRF